jgi:hypothetical protein
MHRLPGEEILPRKKSRSAAHQEIQTAHKATYRKTRICRQQRQGPARAIIRTLARHVDFAAVRNRSF